MSAWLKRDYAPGPTGDEDGVVYLWLKSYAHSRYGVAIGANHDGTPEELAYWHSHQPLVMYLLEHAKTEVLCDPKAPRDAIWAFACTEGDHVHFAVVKRRFKQYRRAMLGELLQGHLAKNAYYTHEIPDLKAAGLMPTTWIEDKQQPARTMAVTRKAA